jgi:hypothetical protein
MEITECKATDVPQLMAFIDKYWNKGHILSKNRAVLDWYYGQPEGCDFLLAKRNNEIFAVLGFIDTERFYQSATLAPELWLALWKVRSDAASPGLGLRLILELKKRFPKRAITVLGLSDEAQKIYSLLRYSVFSLSHLFIYNRQKLNYKLLVGTLPAYQFTSFDGELTLELKPDALHADEKLIQDVRQRGAEYFINKYLENPFYRYQIYCIRTETNVAYAVLRAVTFDNVSALRMVDFWGDLRLLAESVIGFVHLVEQQDMEYLDIYLYADEIPLLLSAGFISRAECDPSVIVPNYFEPFVQQNVDIKCAMEKGFSGPVFKADGDQERPNLVS